MYKVVCKVIPLIIASILVKSSMAQTPAARTMWPDDGRNAEVSKYRGSAWTRPRISKGFNLYSESKERKLGRKLASEFEHSVTILNDEILNAYLAAVVGNLATHSDSKRPFTVKLVVDETIQAYSLPGEHLYVTTGLLLACTNEAEFAGALSHEMAHVVERHGTRQLTRKIVLSSVLAPAFLFAGDRAVVDLSVAFGPLSLNRSGRTFEHQADAAGIHYVYFAGYDPHAFVELLQRIAIQFPDKHSSLMEQFRNHPRIPSRLKRLRKEISMLPTENDYSIVDSSDFQDIKSRLAVALEADSSE